MRFGYARVSRRDQRLEPQRDALLADGCDRVGAAAALETVADLAAARGEPERALRLLAASQRFHEETGIARFPLQADGFDRARTTAHAALDPTDSTASWDAGGELALDVDGRADHAAQVARRDL